MIVQSDILPQKKHFTFLMNSRQHTHASSQRNTSYLPLLAKNLHKVHIKGINSIHKRVCGTSGNNISLATSHVMYNAVGSDQGIIDYTEMETL